MTTPATPEGRPAERGSEWLWRLRCAFWFWRLVPWMGPQDAWSTAWAGDYDPEYTPRETVLEELSYMTNDEE